MQNITWSVGGYFWKKAYCFWTSLENKNFLLDLMTCQDVNAQKASLAVASRLMLHKL